MPLIACAVGGAIGALVSLLLGQLGVGVPPALWIGGGVCTGLAWWVIRRSGIRADDGPLDEPVAHRAGVVGLADRRTRVLEAQVRGAQPGVGTTTGALHATIGELARQRAGAGPYPPNLERYLRAAPRTVDRRHLRMILKELSSL